MTAADYRAAAGDADRLKAEAITAYRGADHGRALMLIGQCQGIAPEREAEWQNALRVIAAAAPDGRAARAGASAGQHPGTAGGSDGSRAGPDAARIPDAARMVQVCLPEPPATFGLAIEDGRVAGAAPIARWAAGRPEAEVRAYYERRGATFRQVPAAPPPGRGLAGQTAARLRAAGISPDDPALERIRAHNAIAGARQPASRVTERAPRTDPTLQSTIWSQLRQAGEEPGRLPGAYEPWRSGQAQASREPESELG
ncbi:MAG TPA: hypothetical protein VMK13_12665 [Streptosporangiaceae bacterium]|nr:hypothetical protein [Streptosporangiaceae bacterium]